MSSELIRCIEDFLNPTEIKAAQKLFEAGELLALYHQLIPLLESAIWQPHLNVLNLQRYQALCVELEQFQSDMPNSDQHHFYVVIPVADRPQHLAACVKSLQLCAESFQYGGKLEGNFNKLTLIIADDSAQQKNIKEHKKLAQEMESSGLPVIYFGLEQQLKEIEQLPSERRTALVNVIGELSKHDFAHKGASLMRNITYLLLRRLAEKNARCLFFFADSDQEFHTNTQSGQPLATTNYFYHLNRIFQKNTVKVLTGKVVGDPPVSPAVMAGTFLDDVIAFVDEVADQPIDCACGFHLGIEQDDGAAYHDMAKLFGFEHVTQAYRYSCSIMTEHNQIDCVLSFAQRLQHFFDGAHPTRSTPYIHHDVADSVLPARTVYTGNYVLSAEALKYFIPFANLKLRMAGPTLGRIIQAEIGDEFVAANLPMLHKRTVEDLGCAEFRPGVNHSAVFVDLSGEYQRQFFGDVMLFSVIELSKQGFPKAVPDETVVLACVMDTENRLRQQYKQTQQEVMGKLKLLLDCLFKSRDWWQKNEDLKQARLLFETFAENIRINFSPQSAASIAIESEQVCEQQRDAIVNAILGYEEDRRVWGV